MNIDSLLNYYFKDCNAQPLIEVFDTENIYNVYSDIVKSLTNYPDIELSVMQALSYCFYEVLDNVLTHSGKTCGTAISLYSPTKSMIQILVADDGMGIQQSLAQNPLYAQLSELEAIEKSIQDTVTDGKGMGFGLYSTSRLIKNVGIRLEIHSGLHILVYDGKETHVHPSSSWQGTIVYFDIHSNREIDPNEIVDNRTDCESLYNETFTPIDDLEQLW
ncbi:MAG: sensor histidine kinase [Bacteroidales bacterium]|nr:sensor histidine kinase [Bacteroidales bacterium]